VAHAGVMLVYSRLEAVKAWTPTIGSPDSRTDENGTITFPHVRLDRYCPVVRVDDFTMLCGEQEVRAGDTEPLVLDLAPYSVRVMLLDAHGEPVLSGKPTLQREGIAPRDGTGPLRIHMWSNLALEARDGWLEVPCLPAGDYTVDVTAGYGNGAARTHVMVRPEVPHPEATLRMPPMGSIVVKLTPAPDAGERQVGILVRQQGEDWTVSNTASCPGEARFDHLVEGTYVVGRHAGPAWLPCRGDPVEVEVKAFETTELTFVAPEGEE